MYIYIYSAGSQAKLRKQILYILDNHCSLLASFTYLLIDITEYNAR